MPSLWKRTHHRPAATDRRRFARRPRGLNRLVTAIAVPSHAEGGGRRRKGQRYAMNERMAPTDLDEESHHVGKPCPWSSPLRRVRAPPEVTSRRSVVARTVQCWTSSTNVTAASIETSAPSGVLSWLPRGHRRGWQGFPRGVQRVTVPNSPDGPHLPHSTPHNALVSDALPLHDSAPRRPAFARSADGVSTKA